MQSIENEEERKIIITGKLVSAPIPVKMVDGKGCFWLESVGFMYEGITVIGSRVIKYYTCVQGSIGELSRTISTNCAENNEIFVKGRMSWTNIDYNRKIRLEYLILEEYGIVHEEEDNEKDKYEETLEKYFLVKKTFAEKYFVQILTGGILYIVFTIVFFFVYLSLKILGV